ncbi:MAG: glycine cleavage system aminomethyltransferase GcvT [Anaerolineales bacterium]|nr:glycine cleavage system aminomethyltransferase GcvT [Anaerolineales bacterium]
MSDFLFRGPLRDIDPDVYELVQIEAERQARKLILIASESAAPEAVREALSSTFQNIYAEGYPDEATRFMVEPELLDYEERLAHYRRYSDPRYYKGVEYADVVEALARRRCAEIFAANGFGPDQVYVNVQALSGAPANNAVYHALVNPGDTVMGMNLLFGGHLTHGSAANRSGKYYRIVPYTIDPVTQKIDMDEVERLAKEHKPKMIIVGYSSYPWAADFKRFRQIADAVGAYLLADMAHVAGLMAAGVYPNPVGIAHVVTFTTHKTLNGPRGACILTTDPALARKIDRAVFPGEQGGPHVNVFAALAAAFKLAATPEFKALQAQTVKNAVRFADRMRAHGFAIPFGGTESHLFNVDCKSVVGPDGTPLMGDVAARVLDLAGVVTNRNTIPGDVSALNPSGLRLGTPWITQRGFKEAEVDALAALMAQVLKACQPFKYPGRKGDLFRAKVDFEAFHDAKRKARALAARAGIDYEPTRHGYPHFYDLDDPVADAPFIQIQVSGERAAEFLNWATTNDVYGLGPAAVQPTRLYTPSGQVEGVLARVGAAGRDYALTVPAARAALALTWLRDLSDGYVAVDAADPWRKLPGPVVVRDCGAAAALPQAAGDGLAMEKPWFIGLSQWAVSTPPELPEFKWQADSNGPLKRTVLNAAHRALGGRMVAFAGWEMPVQYTGVLEEHLATRQAAGLFDVSHMGVWEAAGPTAAAFLDAVVTNEVSTLAPGQSQYAQFLAPNGHVIDDCFVYCRASERYLIVVNASNDDKDWAWVNAVLRGEARVDRERPWAKAPGRGGVTLRDLRHPSAGPDRRVDLALQGPRARDILLALGAEAATAQRVRALKRTGLCDAVIGGFDLVAARTGYTGETMGFELFVHPDRAVELWNALLKAGEPFGLKPCGLAARDSLRTEAGLPLYGEELAGALDLGVGAAGFEGYVKTHKPWFVGRRAFIEQERQRQAEVVRFRFNAKSGRMAHYGDPIVDDRGRVIGQVTSCSIDTEGCRLGQAYVELKYAAEGTPLFVFQSASDKPERPRKGLKIGEKVTLPEPATVLSRFPKRK